MKNLQSTEISMTVHRVSSIEHLGKELALRVTPQIGKVTAYRGIPSDLLPDLRNPVYVLIYKNVSGIENMLVNIMEKRGQFRRAVECFDDTASKKESPVKLMVLRPEQIEQLQTQYSDEWNGIFTDSLALFKGKDEKLDFLNQYWKTMFPYMKVRKFHAIPHKTVFNLACCSYYIQVRFKNTKFWKKGVLEDMLLEKADSMLLSESLCAVERGECLFDPNELLTQYVHYLIRNHYAADPLKEMQILCTVQSGNSTSK